MPYDPPVPSTVETFVGRRPSEDWFPTSFQTHQGFCKVLLDLEIFHLTVYFVT